MTLREKARRSAPGAAARFTAAGATHPGLVRAHNEDAFFSDPARGVFAVVDGIGGQAAGERAAELALRAIRERLERPIGAPVERVREAIALANNEVTQAAATNPEWRGMGCVVVVALIEDERVTVGHVGDARLYALGPRGISRVTTDHSPVGEREARGELSEAEAMRHPRRNEVFRSLGNEEHDPHDEDFVEIDEIPFRPDAALLLCSDGLSDLVPQAELDAIARANAVDPVAVVENLVQAALEAGGKDNVTAVFVAGREFASRRTRSRSGARPSPTVAHATDVETLVPRSVPRPARRAAWLAPALLGLLLGAAATAGALAFWRGGFLSGGTVLAPSGPTAPRELRVGELGAFPTIGAALAAARPGDTVVLTPGTYAELVKLPARVSLVAERAREATLTPPADTPAGAALLVIEGAGPRRIEGLRFAPASSRDFDYGVQVVDGDATLVDLEVTGARQAGVSFEGRGELRMLASAIHDNPGTGVAVGAGASPRLEHNAILDNGRGEMTGRAGVELDPGADARLRANVIAGNAAEGVRGARGAQADAILNANVFESQGRRNRLAAVSGAGTAAGRR